MGILGIIGVVIGGIISLLVLIYIGLWIHDPAAMKVAYDQAERDRQSREDFDKRAEREWKS